MAEAEKFIIDGTLYDISDPTARAAASAASTAASNAQSTANGKLSDAPSDGKQYLRKNGAWAEAEAHGPSLPTGGTIGQVLAKNSDTDGDAGWYNLRHLPSDKWYLPDGILESDVIAAYQFVNRLDEAEAVVNINDGIKYPLSKSDTEITWSSERGFWIPSKVNAKLNNTDLLTRSNNCVSLSFGYSTAKMEDSAVGPGSMLTIYRYLVLNEWFNSLSYAKGPAISKIGTYDVYYCASKLSQGVLSGNFMELPKIYRNGAELSLSVQSNGITSNKSFHDVVFGHRFTDSENFGHCYVTALVFYNIQLSAIQHLQLSNNIRALGGID